VAAGTVEGVGAFTKAGAGILAVTHLRLTPAPLGAAGGNVNVTGGTLQIAPSGGERDSASAASTTSRCSAGGWTSPTTS
jgi:hypothetical protein